MPTEWTDPKYKWGALFKAKSKEELEMLIQESDEMKMAAEKLMKLNEDQIAREIAIAREESQWAWEFTKNAERKQAREEGRVEERVKAEVEKLEIAKSLSANHVPLEVIANSTGIPIEKIQELEI